MIPTFGPLGSFLAYTALAIAFLGSGLPPLPAAIAGVVSLSIMFILLLMGPYKPKEGKTFLVKKVEQFKDLFSKEEIEQIVRSDYPVWEITDDQVLAALRAYYPTIADLELKNSPLKKPMRAALEAAAKASWRQMETAPKDGTKFIGFIPEHNHEARTITVCYFNRKGNYFEGASWSRQPTLWQPLPK